MKNVFLFKELDNKRFSFIVVLIIFLFSCNDDLTKDNVNINLPPIPYTVLYKDSIQIDNNYYGIGIVMIQKNTATYHASKYLSHFESTVEICKIEGLAYVEFYKTHSESNDSIALLGKKTGIHGNFFIGKIDALKYKTKWKEKINIDDFNYYNTDSIPIRIRPRLPALN